MLELSRLTPIMLALAGAAVPTGFAYSIGSGPELLPAHPTAPADGTVIATESGPLAVKLAWSIPPEPVPVRFFVEVMAIGHGKLREVFAAYIDQSSVDVALAGGPEEYAWRVYTVGRDVAAYALSDWERFSLQLKK